MRSLEKFRGKHGENPSVIRFPLERSERSADHLDFLDRLHMIAYHGERRDLKHKDRSPGYRIVSELLLFCTWPEDFGTRYPSPSPIRRYDSILLTVRLMARSEAAPS